MRKTGKERYYVKKSIVCSLNVFCESDSFYKLFTGHTEVDRSI